VRWIIILIVLGVVVYFLMNRGGQETAPPAADKAAPVTASAPAVQPAAPPQSAPAAAPAEDKQARMAELARSMDMELRAYEAQDSGAVITVAWGGDNAARGGDFLEQCAHQGIIRDFDPAGRYSEAMENGRRIFLARVTVRF